MSVNIMDDATMLASVKFDNVQFEREIKTTQNSLENFSKKLKDFDGVTAFKNFGSSLKTKSLDVLANTTDKLFKSVNKETQNVFEQTERGIGSIRRTLNNLKNELEIGFVRDLGAKLSGKITELVKEFTGLAGMMQGFGQYETTVQSTKAIMNSTGMSQSEVEEYLDRLVFFSDETSYDYATMLDNVKKIISTGVDPKKAMEAVEGIATWAAQSGASKTEFGIAVNNMVQAIGSGSLKMIDWKSIMRSSVSMATPEFKQTVLKVLSEMGSVSKQAYTEALGDPSIINKMFDDAMSNDLITTDAILHVLGDNYGRFGNYVYDYMAEHGINSISEYSGDLIEELSKHVDANGFDFGFSGKAFEAAREYTSLTDAISATQDAVKSGWATTFQYIFGNYEEAKSLWTYVGDSMYELALYSHNNRNAILDEWYNFGGRTYLLAGLKNMADNFMTIVDSFRTGWREIFWPKDITDDETGEVKLTAAQRIGRRWANITKSFKDFTSRFVISEETKANLTSTFKGLFAILDILKQIGGAVGKQVLRFVNWAFPKVGQGLGSILKQTGSLGEWLSEKVGFLRDTHFFDKLFSNPINLITKLTNALKIGGGAIADFFKWVFTGKRLSVEGIEKTINPLITAGENVREVFLNLFEDLKKAYQSGGIVGIIKAIAKKISDAFGTIKNTISNGLSNIFKTNGNGVRGFFDNLKTVIFGPKDGQDLDQGSKTISSSVGNIVDASKKLSSAVSTLTDTGKTGGLIGKLKETFGPAIDKVKEFFAMIGEKFVVIKDFLSNAGINFSTIVKLLGVVAALRIGTGIKKTANSVNTFGKSIETAATSVKDGMTGIGNGISSVGKAVKESALTVKDVKTTVRTYNFKSIAAAILMFVGSFALIVYSLIKLADVATSGNEKSLWIAAGIVGGIFAALGVLLGVLTALERKVTEFDKSKQKYESSLPQLIGMSVVIGTVAAAVYKLAKAIIKMADLKPEQLITGALVVADLLLMIGLLMRTLIPLSKDAHMLPIGATIAIASMGISILGLATRLLGSLAVLDKDGKIDGASTAWRLLAAVGPIVGILIAMMFTFKSLFKALGNALPASEAKGVSKKLVGLGLMLTLTSVALSLMLVPMEVLGHTKWSVLIKGSIFTVGLMFALMGAFKLLIHGDAFTIQPGAAWKAGLGMIAMATALTMMLIPIEVLAHTKSYNWVGMEKAIGSIALLIGLMAGAMFLVSLPKGNGAWKAGVAMMAMSAALLMIIAPIEILAHTRDWTSMEKAVKSALGIIVTLGIVFAGLAFVLSLAKNFGPKQASGLLILSSSLLIASGAILALSLIPWEKALSSAAALGIVMTALMVASRVIPENALDKLNKLSTVILKFAGAAALVGVVLIAVTNLIKVIKELDNAKEIIDKALDMGAQAIKNKAPDIGSAAVSVVASTMKSLGEMGPSIADGLMTFLIGLIRTIAGRVDELIPAIKELGTNFSKSFAENFGQIDTVKLKYLNQTLYTFAGVVVFLGLMKNKIKGAIASVVAIGLLIGFITAAMLLLSSLDTSKITAISKALALVGGVFGTLGAIITGIFGTSSMFSSNGAWIFTGKQPSILSSIQGAVAVVAAMGILVMGLVGLTALLGELNKIPGSEALLERGAKMMELVGNILGSFVGGIVGGVMTSVTDALPAVGTNLSEFMTNLSTFFEGVRSISDSDMDKCETLFSSIGKLLLGATFLGAGGIAGLSQMATAMDVLAPTVVEFSKNTSGINKDTVTASAALLGAMASIVDASQGLATNGLKNLFTGTVDFEGFVSGLSRLAVPIKDLAKVGEELNPEDVENVSKVLTMLAEASRAIPNSGGLAGLILGNNDLDDFANMIGTFADVMTGEDGKGGALAKMRGLELNDSDADQIKRICDLITAFAMAADEIPNSGWSLSKLILGDNELDEFGRMIANFAIMLHGVGNAPGIIDLIRDSNVSAEDERLVGSVTRILTKFAGVAAAIPNFSNDFNAMAAGAHNTDLSEFGSMIATMIETLSGTMEVLRGESFDVARLDTLGATVKTFSEIQNDLKGTGLGTNTTALSSFGAELKSLITNLVLAYELYDEKYDISGMLTNMYNLYTQMQSFATHKSKGITELTELIQAYSEAATVNAIKSATDGGQGNVSRAGTSLGAGYVASVIKELTQLARKVEDVLEQEIALITGGTGFQNGWESFGSQIMANIDKGMATKSLGKDLPKFASALLQFYDTIGKMDVTKLSTLVTQIKELVVESSSLHDDLVKLATDMIGDFGSSLTFLSSDITAPFTNAGASVMDAFASGATTKMEALAIQILTPFVDLAGIYAPSFANAGSAMMDALGAGISRQSSRAKVKECLMQSILKSLINSKGEIYSEAHSVGVYLMQGIDGGMRSYTGPLMQTIAHIGDDLITTLRAHTKVESPSKLSYEVGRFIDVGLSNALVDYSSLVYNSAGLAGDSAIAGVRDSVMGLAAAIELSEDSTPVIRPIVDLSDVEASANQIDAIMANRRILSMGASIEGNQNEAANASASSGSTVNFTQINNSPKALSRIEIYRQTKSQLSKVERMVRA